VTTRVVIADDEAIIRLDLKEILVEAGYEVVGEAGNGDDALRLIRDQDPDLALLDVKMPGMTGLEVARALDSSRPSVVLLTAFSQRDMIEEARAAGVSAYLVKPFRRHELLPALRAVVERAKETQALEDEGGSAAEDKLETRRRVDAAKAVLIDECGLEEHEAFAFIQKTAMTSRQRMREVADQVVAGTLRP